MPSLRSRDLVVLLVLEAKDVEANLAAVVVVRLVPALLLLVLLTPLPTAALSTAVAVGVVVMLSVKPPGPRSLSIIVIFDGGGPPPTLSPGTGKEDAAAPSTSLAFRVVEDMNDGDTPVALMLPLLAVEEGKDKNCLLEAEDIEEEEEEAAEEIAAAAAAMGLEEDCCW